MSKSISLWDELAIQSYKTILKHHSNNPLIHCNLGLVYLRIGKLSPAMHSFQRAVKCDASYAEAHYHLGVVFQRLGEKKKAIKHLSTYSNLKANDKTGTDIVEELLKKLEAD